MKMPEYVAVKITPNDKATAYSLEVIPNADFVNVVRCKDCRHARKYKLFGEEEIQCERSSLDAYFWVEEGDFCSYGEKVTE